MIITIYLTHCLWCKEISFFFSFNVPLVQFLNFAYDIKHVSDFLILIKHAYFKYRLNYFKEFKKLMTSENNLGTTKYLLKYLKTNKTRLNIELYFYVIHV